MPRSAQRPAKTTQHQLRGIPAAPGIVIGPALPHETGARTAVARPVPSAQIEREIKRFLAAVEKTRGQIRDVRDQVEREIDRTHAAIFESHLQVLEDPLLIDQTVAEIRAERLCAEFIFQRNIQRLEAMFAKIQDQHFRDRQTDLTDVGQGVLRNLMGHSDALTDLERDAVIVAHDLSPSDTAQMGSAAILGFVCAIGGPTGHTAIMAKALERPAVLGVGDGIGKIAAGDLLIVDGNEGLVIVNPTADTLATYRRARSRTDRRRRDMAKLRDLPAETADGYRITLAANVELPEEIDHVIEHGAQGIGLFRTEFLFLNRAEMPDEETQTQVYTQVARRLKPAPVVFRTIDIGGDKFLSTLSVSQEINPFLGVRAIRLCLEHPDIFKVQLRAMLRASARGNVHIMLPMISSVEEVHQAKEILAEVRADLLADGVPIAEQVPLGVMIETPSAALTTDALAREVDFFSIGTNDLIQYTLAVDRVNEKVAHLYQPLHPAVLRLLRTTIEAAHREGIWCGLCGEMAADPEMVPILIGLGLDELSMSAVAIPRAKQTIRQLRLSDCERMVEDLLSRRTVKEVKSAARRAAHARAKRTP